MTAVVLSSSLDLYNTLAGNEGELVAVYQLPPLLGFATPVLTHFSLGARNLMWVRFDMWEPRSALLRIIIV